MNERAHGNKRHRIFDDKNQKKVKKPRFGTSRKLMMVLTGSE